MTSIKTVLVDGATGYVGGHLINALNSAKYEVHALVHRGAKREDLQMLESLPVKVYVADLQDRQSMTRLRQAFEAVDAACHLIGSIAPRRGEKFENLHVLETRSFVEQCREACVKRMIMVTALGSSKTAASEYHRSKWLAEQELVNSGIDHVILRPSLIVGRTFGKRNSKVINRYLTFIDRGNFVPIIGDGANKVQPIFIDDLVKSILVCLRAESNNEAILGRALELGGDEIVTMKHLVEQLMQAVGKRAPLKSIPFSLAQISACFCQLFQAVPTLSLDQVRLSQQDNTCEKNALPSLLGANVTKLAHAFATYARVNKMDLEAEFERSTISE